MRIKTITINNLFSYYGENRFEFDLSTDSSRNITIISGRNGGGKTSFLTSVKMLFMGTSKEVRNFVQRKRTPTPKQFVCGVEPDWEGILNLKARRDKKDKKECGIRIEWISEANEHITAERLWKLDLDKGNYETWLKVDAGYQGILENEEADEYLEQCLPKNYVPYFFFDGEDLESLAEANSEEIITTMIRILNIRPLQNIQAQLRELQTKWQSLAKNKDKKKELAVQQAELTVKEAELASLEQNRSDKKDQLSEKEDELEQIKRELKYLWATPNKESEARLEEKLLQKETDINERYSELGKIWSRDGFLKTTSSIIDRVIKIIEENLQNSAATQSELLSSLKDRLTLTFTTPPYPNPRLEESQVRFLKDRILKEIEVFSTGSDNELIFNIDSNKALQLSRVLSPYQSANQGPDEIAQKTSVILKLRKEIFDLKKDLRNVSNLTQKDRERFELLSKREEAINDDIRKFEGVLSKFETQEESIKSRITELEKNIAIKEKNLDLANGIRMQYEFTRKISELLSKVEERLRKKCKDDIGKNYNRFLKTLLDSNRLIEKVEINDLFEISYRDIDGNRIGMSSISSGMKQLSATSLLWALKAVSGINVPVVIDTPLGRIDLMHQANLLKSYYPKVGEQVIILPTDSELDDRKRSIIKPYISREFFLENPEGKETKVTLKNG